MIWLTEIISNRFIRYVCAFFIIMAQHQPPNVGGGKISRRDFLKLLAAAGTVMTFTPFVDWGKFLPNPKEASGKRAKVMLPDGSQANVKTFKVKFKLNDKAMKAEYKGDGALIKESEDN